MASLLDHFRRHVLSASAETVGDFSAVEPGLRQSKISDLDMSIVIDQQILRFEVSIDDVLLMQVHESIKNFYEVESSIGLGHSFDGFEVIEEFSAWTICIRMVLHSRTKQTK